MRQIRSMWKQYVNSKFIWISLRVRALQAITLISIRKERKRERWKERTKIKNKTRRRQTQFGSGKFIVRKWNTRVRSGKYRWLYSSVRHYQDLAFRLLKCAAATRKYWQLKVLASLFQSWTRPGFTFRSHYSRKFAFKSYGEQVVRWRWRYFFLFCESKSSHRGFSYRSVKRACFHEGTFIRQAAARLASLCFHLITNLWTLGRHWIRWFNRSNFLLKSYVMAIHFLGKKLRRSFSAFVCTV